MKIQLSGRCGVKVMAGPNNWAFSEEPKIREKWVADSSLTSLFFMLPCACCSGKMSCRYVFECFVGAVGTKCFKEVPLE